MSHLLFFVCHLASFVSWWWLRIFYYSDVVISISVALYLLLVKLKLVKSDYIKEGFCLKIIQLYLLKGYWSSKMVILLCKEDASLTVRYSEFVCWIARCSDLCFAGLLWSSSHIRITRSNMHDLGCYSAGWWKSVNIWNVTFCLAFVRCCLWKKFTHVLYTDAASMVLPFVVMFTITSVFMVDLTRVSRPDSSSVFFLHLFQKRTIGNKWHQRTRCHPANPHWPQPGTITHWPCHFFTYHTQTTDHNQEQSPTDLVISSSTTFGPLERRDLDAFMLPIFFKHFCSDLIWIPAT